MAPDTRKRDRASIVLPRERVQQLRGMAEQQGVKITTLIERLIQIEADRMNYDELPGLSITPSETDDGRIVHVAIESCPPIVLTAEEAAEFARQIGDILGRDNVVFSTRYGGHGTTDIEVEAQGQGILIHIKKGKKSGTKSVSMGMAADLRDRLAKAARSV